MKLDDVKTMAAGGESETLEFKTTTSGKVHAVETVCAFLNHRGGRVLFGVKPDGSVAGQQIGNDTIERLSAEIRQIQPPAFPEVDRVRVGGDYEVIVVNASPSRTRPHTYRGRAYKRIGNTTSIMSSDEYDQMLLERMHGEQRWENQPATGWSVRDLDVVEIERTVTEAIRRGRLSRQAGQKPPDVLRGLGLLRNGTMLRAAAALFGKTERVMADMPQCLLRVARFRGTDKTEFLDNRQFAGNAFALLNHAERFLRDTLPIAGHLEPDRFERVDEPRYPVLATREAIANAICHQDYSVGGGSVGIAVYDDRLEVTSTGSLHFGLTPKKLFGPHQSQPWNPLIARAFYMRGVIEEWGSGTLNMAKLARAYGLPRPDIEDDGGCVTVRFRHGRSPPESSGQSDSARTKVEIVELLRRHEDGLARREIHSLLDVNVSVRQVRRALEELRDNDMVEIIGRRRWARWRAVRFPSSRTPNRNF